MKPFTKLLLLGAILGGYEFGELAPANACERKYEECVSDCRADHPNNEHRRLKCDRNCQHRLNECVEFRSPVYIEPEPPIVVDPRPWPWWWHHHRHWH